MRRFINQAWHINTSAWRCACTRHFDYDMLIWPIIYFLSSLCHLRRCPAHVCPPPPFSMFPPAPSDVLPVLASLLLETMLPKLYTKKSIFKTLANNCSSIPTMLGRLIAWFDIVYYEIIKGWDGGGEASITEASIGYWFDRAFCPHQETNAAVSSCPSVFKKVQVTKKEKGGGSWGKLSYFFPVTPINFSTVPPLNLQQLGFAPAP